MVTKLKLRFTFLIVAISSILFRGTLMAQDHSRAGIKAGLNVSNLYMNNVNNENSRLGFTGGLYGQPFSSDAFALQMELLYSTKGSQDVYNGIFNETVRFNLNYLEVPVIAVFKLGKVAEIHAGGYASYLLNTNVTYTGNSGNGAEELNRDKFKSFDVGLVGGFALNFGVAQVGLRYDYGLSKIANSDAARNFVGDSKNSSTQIYLALNLNE